MICPFFISCNYILVKAYDWHTILYDIIQNCCIIRWKIDTSVRSACKINITAEFISP